MWFSWGAHIIVLQNWEKKIPLLRHCPRTITAEGGHIPTVPCYLLHLHWLFLLAAAMAAKTTCLSLDFRLSSLLSISQNLKAKNRLKKMRGCFLYFLLWKKMWRCGSNVKACMKESCERGRNTGSHSLRKTKNSESLRDKERKRATERWGRET